MFLPLANSALAPLSSSEDVCCLAWHLTEGAEEMLFSMELDTEALERLHEEIRTTAEQYAATVIEQSATAGVIAFR